MGGPFGRERKRPRLMRNVYSDNPLFEARRTAGRLAADEDAASSGSDVAAGGESSDPALSSSPARLATLLHPPARPVANRSVQMLRSPPRPPQLAVEVKSKRAVPNAGDAVLPFRLPGLVIVEQPQDAQDDADADGTDSETESEVVSSLLLPTTSAAALNPLPSLSSDTPSSSSPLRSPSQRLRPPTSSKPSIDRPVLPLKPILKPFPQPLPALLAKDEREGQRKNGRGRRHVVGWESEKRAKEKAEEVRERRKQLSESKKRKREAVDAGEGAGGKGKERAAASSSTSAAASSTAAGSKSRGRVTRSGKTSGDGGNGGGNGDDDQRRRKRPLPSGNGNGGPGAPSQTPSPALDSIGTKRFAYAVAADDPVLLMTPLLTLRSSLRPTEAFDSAYEGAAPALPPRPHPDVPPLVEVEGAPGVPVFPSPPTLLNDVEDAYVALKNALFQLPATFDAAVTLTPLRTHASTLLGALTRDIGNIKTFPAWVKEQPISQNNDGGLSSPFPPASDDLISSPAGQPAPSSESSSNGAMRTSLTESQMRRMRDEVAVAQAAIKCAAVIVRDERLIEAFEGEHPLPFQGAAADARPSRSRVARVARFPRLVDSPRARNPRHGPARPLPLHPLPHPVTTIIASAHSAAYRSGHTPCTPGDAIDGNQDRPVPLRLLRVARRSRETPAHKRSRPSRRRCTRNLASSCDNGTVGGVEEGLEHAREDDAGARQGRAGFHDAAGGGSRCR